MTPEDKLEKKIESIARGLLSNFNKAGLYIIHQRKIIKKASQLLNL